MSTNRPSQNDPKLFAIDKSPENQTGTLCQKQGLITRKKVLKRVENGRRREIVSGMPERLPYYRF
jgi:hypothetical protein